MTNTPPTAGGPETSPTNQSSKFNHRKMKFVIAALLGVVIISWVVGGIFGIDKFLVVAGLIIAAAGQLLESLMKTPEVQARPGLLDGFELFGEGLKFYGALAAILGVAFGLDG